MLNKLKINFYSYSNLKKVPLATTTVSTTSQSTSKVTSFECIHGWYLFQGGMTQCQAQTEGGSIGNTVNEGVSGYWYISILMTNEMCINSCLKYGFTMAAINP